MPPGNDLVWQIFGRAALLLFLVTSAAGLAVGVGLILRGGETLRWLGDMNRWTSTRRRFKPLEVPRDIGPVLHRHRLWIGAALAAIGAYALATFLTGAGRAATVGALRIEAWAAPFVEAVWWVLVAGSAAAVAVGISMVFFPRLLAALEARSDRWVSTRQAVRVGEHMHVPLDGFVRRNPRAAGWIISVLCVIAAGGSAMLLFVLP